MESHEPAPQALPTASVCLECGGPLHATGVGMLCPVCLMERVISGGGLETPSEARTFGDYQLLEELGRGGAGVVYRAWHATLERTVALKMLLGGPFAGPEVTAHFGREVKIVAGLRHPGIVAVYEAGEVEGIRFFTMELVEGRTLASLLRDGPLDPIRASAYVRKAALAVEHAHGQRILHRDLKPSNILIGPTDDPKVADFGLARVWSGGAEQTVNLGLMGSPPYMAPEQVSGGPVGPGADIYGLGAMLYHLLTGRPPHMGARIEDVLTRVRQSPAVAPRLLNPAVPRDLETICLKCLEKDPGRRYASAAAFAADLGRFERGEPVLARPVGIAGRALRWSLRNRALAAALAALALVLLTGAGAVVGQADINRRERNRLELERYTTATHAASLAAIEGDFPLARHYLSSVIPVRGPPDLRGFEWRLLWAMTASQAGRVLHPHAHEIEQIAFSPDGSRLATNSFDGTATWSDFEGSKTSGLGTGGGWALAFTPDGTGCYVGVGSEGRGSDTVQLVDTASGRTLWSTPGWRISLSGDGRRLAVARGQPLAWMPADGGVEIWDTGSRARLAQIDGKFRACALSPDGAVIALAPAGAEVLLRTAVGGRELARLATSGPQSALAYSPDGRLLASCGLGEASIWRVADASQVARLEHPWLRVWSAAFSPDSSLLATTCSDRAVRIWDTSDGRLLRTLRGHADEVWSVAFSPDGSRLASGGKDGSVLLWEVRSPTQPLDFPFRGWFRPLQSPDGATLVVVEGYTDPLALVYRSGQPVQKGPQGWSACGFSADGSNLLLWSAREEPALRWWSPASGAFGAAFLGAQKIGLLPLVQTGLSTDGRWAFQLGSGNTLMVWNAAGGPPVRTCELPGGPSAIRSIALSRDALWLAWSRVAENDVGLADVAHGKFRKLTGHHNTVSGVAFSPGGEQLASASADGTVRLWDCASAASLAVLYGHPESADDVAFSPDGRTLASLGSLQSIRFWCVANRSETATLELPEAGGFLSFSPDGRHLAVTLADVVSGGDRGTRVFDAPDPIP
jgi:WD40 repeat protein